MKKRWLSLARVVREPGQNLGFYLPLRALFAKQAPLNASCKSTGQGMVPGLNSHVSKGSTALPEAHSE